MYVFAWKQREKKSDFLLFIAIYVMIGLAHLTFNKVLCGPWTQLSLTPLTYSIYIALLK